MEHEMEGLVCIQLPWFVRVVIVEIRNGVPQRGEAQRDRAPSCHAELSVRVLLGEIN